MWDLSNLIFRDTRDDSGSWEEIDRERKAGPATWYKGFKFRLLTSPVLSDQVMGVITHRGANLELRIPLSIDKSAAIDTIDAGVIFDQTARGLIDFFQEILEKYEERYDDDEDEDSDFDDEDEEDEDEPVSIGSLIKQDVENRLQTFYDHGADNKEDPDEYPSIMSHLTEDLDEEEEDAPEEKPAGTIHDSLDSWFENTDPSRWLSH